MSLSAETAGIVALIRSFKLPHRITSITGGEHVPSSYHYKRGTGGVGLAVDIAGPIPYNADPAGAKAAMMAICKELEPYHHSFAELICSHLSYSIKAGKKVPRMSVLTHYNHIHLAVAKGVILAQPTDLEATVVPDDPNLPNIEGPCTFHPVINNTTGECRGYYIFAPETVELHSYGPGAGYFGRSEDTTPG